MRIGSKINQGPGQSAAPSQGAPNLADTQVSLPPFPFRNLPRRSVNQSPQLASTPADQHREIVKESRPFNFDRWYTEYNGLVTAVVRRQIKDHHRAKDIVQDVWQKLARIGDRYDSSRSKETTFILLITKRAIIDELRRGKHRPRPQSDLIEESGGSQSPRVDPIAEINPLISHDRRTQTEDLHRKDAVGLVLSLIRSLDPKKRAVIELVYLRGLTLSEIALLHGEPLGSVKSKLSRGLAQLRREFRNSTHLK